MVIEPEVTILSVEAVSPSNPANELTGGARGSRGEIKWQIDHRGSAREAGRSSQLEGKSRHWGKRRHVAGNAAAIRRRTPVPTDPAPPPLSSRQESGPMADLMQRAMV